MAVSFNCIEIPASKCAAKFVNKSTSQPARRPHRARIHAERFCDFSRSDDKQNRVSRPISIAIAGSETSRAILGNASLDVCRTSSLALSSDSTKLGESDGQTLLYHYRQEWKAIYGDHGASREMLEIRERAI